MQGKTHKMQQKTHRTPKGTIREKDHAGSCIRYNKTWHKNTGIPLVWIEGAGHNSNTDAPDKVNALIQEFASTQVLR